MFSPGIFEKESEPVEEFYRKIETTETFDNIDKEQFLDAIGNDNKVADVKILNINA